MGYIFIDIIKTNVNKMSNNISQSPIYKVLTFDIKYNNKYK